mmetsp:Transcript_4014/g.8933  ORF Transcript_4014/g.8933 Transcript_4014/m.8933 type:complete len:225 (-) Transcript_4014:3176-3850(-)
MDLLMIWNVAGGMDMVGEGTWELAVDGHTIVHTAGVHLIVVAGIVDIAAAVVLAVIVAAETARTETDTEGGKGTMTGGGMAVAVEMMTDVDRARKSGTGIAPPAILLETIVAKVRAVAVPVNMMMEAPKGVGLRKEAGTFRPKLRAGGVAAEAAAPQTMQWTVHLLPKRGKGKTPVVGTEEVGAGRESALAGAAKEVRVAVVARNLHHPRNGEVVAEADLGIES